MRILQKELERHSPFGVKMQEGIMRAHTRYIICIKRKRRHADKEDPEETRDKEPQISEESAPPRALPKTNSVLLLAVPSPAPPLPHFLLLFVVQRCFYAPVHAQTRDACIVWAHVYPPSSRIHAFYDRSAAPLSAVYTCTVLSVYTQGMYSQANDALRPSVLFRCRNVAICRGESRRHQCVGKSHTRTCAHPACSYLSSLRINTAVPFVRPIHYVLYDAFGFSCLNASHVLKDMKN